MTKQILKPLLVSFILLLCYSSRISANTTKLISKKGFNLTFVTPSSWHNEAVNQHLIEVFFKVYPKLVKTFNKDATRNVKVSVDSLYDGVAYANNGAIVISQAWLEKHPEDTDLLTHEVMHLVQAYPNGSGPGWLTEGIADYVRFKFGVDNKGAGWSLPAFKSSFSYTNSYRVTAGFLNWLEAEHNGLVKSADKLLRAKTFTNDFWEKQTGKSLDSLWDDYAKQASKTT
ncbi:basic secretory family protein [Pedobacter sp. MC2016-14]|uniref:basic secretory family protein n=1 Tax=Pedobacter sp. MC2016-14 TaxID=2897327 RepID=UPI001E3EEEFE|nr:basic secretory family protein [Pedobacter sp. MC2016-14]MCD0490471.1 basic secretory family protein [Pedobacter sp. MC2016-14]